MNSKINTIKNTFSDIKKEIINKGVDISDCDPVTKYAEKIRSIPSGSGSGFTSVTAYVEEVGQDSPMTADVEVINDTLAFTFGLRAGAPGRDGYDGQDGNPGQDGYSYKTSYIFIRSNSTPNTPKGGSFDNPTSSDWSDSIPDGNEMVWMSICTFKSDNTSTGWSKPQHITDTSTFQVEFSTSSEITNIDRFTGNESEWRKSQLDKYGIKWVDPEDSDSANAIWMATATCHNGDWGDWSVVKVKGEKGEKGEKGTPGSSVYIEGKFPNLEALKAAWTSYINGDSSKFTGTLDPGDGYFIDETGYLYVYSGGWNKNESDSNFDLYWTGVELKGEKGDEGIPGVNGEDGRNAYLYVRYSDDAGSTFTENNVPGKYIGVLFGVGDIEETIINNPGSYDWKEWTGEDGWGYEQIFVLTTDTYNIQNPPFIPSENVYEPEHLPVHNLGENAPGTNWCDTPQTVTKEYPYCWVVTRTRSGNAYGNWKGDEQGRAHLYSRYAYDGTSFVHLELSNDQAVIPLENGVVDPDFTDEITTKMSLYIGASPVESGVVYSINNSFGTCNAETGEVVLDKSKLNDISIIECKAEYNNKSYTKNFYIHKTNNAYEIVSNKHIIKRDAATGYIVEGDQTITVEVKKWDGQKWIVPNTSIVVTCEYINSPSDEKHYLTMGKPVNIELKNQYITNVRLSLITNDVELTFEEIGVIVNGEDGPGQEYIYYRSETEGLITNPTEYKNNTYNDKSYQDSDWYPSSEGWTDVPSGVNSTQKYEYVSSRKKQNGIWGDFSNPVLWAKYSVDGNSISKITEYYLASPNSSGITNDVDGWSTTIPILDATNKYLWNYEQIEYSIYESSKTTPVIIGTYSQDGKGIDSIIEYYQISNDPVNAPSSWETVPPKPTSDNKYLWNYETIKYTDGSEKNTDPVIIGVYEKGETGKDGTNGIDGRSVTSITKKYALGNDATSSPSSFTVEDPSTLTTDFENNRFIWCEETTNYSDGTDTVIKYIITVHGEPGATGVGTKGPIIYPAGVWNPYSAYTVTDTKVPYVYYAEAENKDDRYWILKKDVAFNTDGTNIAPINDSEHWDRMESYEAIYSDIGVFNSALIGKFVFAGEYIFSQDGFGSSSEEYYDIPRRYDDYEDVTSAIVNYVSNSNLFREKRYDLLNIISTHNWFRPNILINAVTGKIFMSNTEIGLENAIITTESVSLPEHPLIGQTNKTDLTGTSLLSLVEPYNGFNLLNHTFVLGDLDFNQNVAVKAGQIVIKVGKLYSHSSTGVTSLESMSVSKINYAKIINEFDKSELATLNVNYPEIISTDSEITISWDDFIYEGSNVHTNVISFKVQCELNNPNGDNAIQWNDTVFGTSIIEYDCEMDSDPPAKTIISADGFALQTTKSVCTISSNGEFIFKAGLFGFKMDSSGFHFMNNGNSYIINNNFFMN